MLRADLQEERSAAQRQDPAGEAALIPVQDSDVVRDGETYYLVINNLGEGCLHAPLVDCSVVFCHHLLCQSQVVRRLYIGFARHSS